MDMQHIHMRASGSNLKGRLKFALI
jgi:hypothetical protein